MREVKFRGKSKDDNKTYDIAKGQWVYGYYYEDVEDTNDEQSFENCFYIKMKYGDHFVDIEVIPQTVGEYTGFKDKKRQEIYEGNIVKAWHEENNGLGYREYNDVGKVVWGNGCWIIKMTSRDSIVRALFEYDTELDIEIIKEI